MNLLQIVDMSQVRGSNYGSKKMALFISAITTYLYNYIWYMYLHTYTYVCVLQSTIQKKTNEASQLTYMYILWLDSSLFCSRAKKYYNKHSKVHTNHTNIHDRSSEKIGLCSMKMSSQMFQNLLCLCCKKKTHVVIVLFFIWSNFTFSLMNALMLTQTRAFIREKIKLLEMKNKKKLHGFSFYINIVYLKHLARHFH